MNTQTGKPEKPEGYEDATSYTVSPSGVETPPAGRQNPPSPAGGGSTSSGTRRGRRPRAQADERLIRQSLVSALSVTNLGLMLTGNVKYEFTTNEIEQLADVWTAVIMHYPPLTMWFDKGNELTDWARAIILSAVIMTPKFTGVDLNKPVNTGNQNGTSGSTSFGSVPNGAGNNGTANPIESALDPSGRTRADGGHNGIGEDNPSQIFSIG